MANRFPGRAQALEEAGLLMTSALDACPLAAAGWQRNPAGTARPAGGTVFNWILRIVLELIYTHIRKSRLKIVLFVLGRSSWAF